MRFLRTAPAGDLAVLDLDQRARRPHARMGLERPFVFGLDHARGRLERLVDIAGFRGLHRTLARRRLADVIVERGLIGERRRRVRPDHLELLRRLDRVPLLVGDDAEEALVPDHLGGRDIFDRALVDTHRHGAGDRRTDHAGMDHAGHFHVGAEVFLREHLWRDVFALDRLADDLVVLRIFRLRLARRVERIAVFAVPVEMDVEVTPADELGVAHLLGGIAHRMDNTVGDRQLIGRHVELVGRHGDQHAPRFGCGHAHLPAALLQTGRAGRAALIDAGCGVAHEHLDGLERHIELFGDDLPDGGEQSLSHIHLAEIGGNGAVAVDGDVRRQLVGRQRRLGGDRHRVVGRVRERGRRADRDDERTAGLENGAARKDRGFVLSGHGALPQPIIAAARLTARKIAIWVPQRHFSPVKASRISASVGFFLSRRNAAAVMIQPLMQ